MQGEFLERKIDLLNKRIKIECFKPDRYIDVIRFQKETLGSIFSSPYVVEFYLNYQLYIRIPSLTFAESERYVKLNHKQLNYFGSSYFKMQDFLTQFHELAGESKKYIDDHLSGEGAP
jgi:hypothetical protein